MRGLIFGVTPLDPATFVTVGLAYGTVAILATLLPALRAARVDPVISLYSD